MTSTQIPKINDMEREGGNENDDSPPAFPLPSDRHLMDDLPNKVSSNSPFQKRNDMALSAETPSTSRTTFGSSERMNVPKRHEKEIEDRKKVGLCTTIFMLLPISISGATVSLLAFSFHLAGLGLGMFIFTLNAVITVYTSYLLMVASKAKNSPTYHGLGGKTICKYMKVAIAIMNFYSLMGAAVAATVFNKNVAFELIMGLWPDIAHPFNHRQFWAAAMVWIIVFPLLTCPRISGIGYISYFTSAVAVVYAIISIAGLNKFGTPQKADIKIASFELQNYLVSFTLFMHPLINQPVVQPIFEEMKRPTIGRIATALTLNTGICYVLYAIIGVTGYLTFANPDSGLTDLEEKENIFKTSIYSDWMPVKITAFIFFSTTITLILAILMPVKHITLELMRKKKDAACGWQILACFIDCAILLFVSIIVETTADVISFNGLALYPIMCFVFPALFYLRAGLRNTPCVIVNKFFACLLILFMVCISISGWIKMFKSQ